MVCFHPLKGYRARSPSGNGGYRIVFNVRDGYADKPQQVPCGQCQGCRLERSRQWAVRCMHEAKLHEDNCFITLTYSDDHLPDGGTLVKSDFQKFMKKFRKYAISTAGAKLRYYMAGEYGDTFGRPHYHVCVFGYDFPDKVPYTVSGAGDTIYISPALDRLWDKGISTIGAVTFESAAYTARYVMKKVTGKGADRHYEDFDPETGVVFYREPEYNDMSRGSGIGKGWLDKFTSDVYPRDFVVVNGVKARPPRFYDNKFEIIDPVLFKKLKARRVRNSRKHADNNTPDRLRVREEVALAKVRNLKRSLG